MDVSEEDQLAAAIAASLENDREEVDLAHDEEEEKQEAVEVVPLAPEPDGELHVFHALKGR